MIFTIERSRSHQPRKATRGLHGTGNEDMRGGEVVEEEGGCETCRSTMFHVGRGNGNRDIATLEREREERRGFVCVWC